MFIGVLLMLGRLGIAFLLETKKVAQSPMLSWKQHRQFRIQVNNRLIIIIFF